MLQLRIERGRLIGVHGQIGAGDRRAFAQQRVQGLRTHVGAESNRFVGERRDCDIAHGTRAFEDLHRHDVAEPCAEEFREFGVQHETVRRQRDRAKPRIDGAAEFALRFESQDADTFRPVSEAQAYGDLAEWFDAFDACQ